jgi:imidazolonepropionase-like amidohydrolase
MRTLITIREPGGDPRPVAIEDGRFADPDAGPIDRELDTGHLFATAGLADCHAHLSMQSLQDRELTEERMRDNTVRHAWMQLEGGVLLVLDKGSGGAASLTILDEAAPRRPELQMAGKIISAPGGYFSGFGVEVDDAGLAAAVREAATGPATWVKLIGDWPRKGEGPKANFTEAALAKAVRIAHAAGCRLAVHTMAPQVASIAVAAGADSIEHGTFLTSDDLEALAARGGAWVPTVCGVEAIIDFLGIDSSGGRLLAAGLNNLRRLIPEAERLGVAVLTGTDLALPHGGVAVEANKLVEYGMSGAGALAAASTAAYDYAGIPRGFEPGLPADAVFFTADPREEPETLRAPELILRVGAVVQRAG